ncbi:MAG TPA: glycoside hydrolase family 15 protein [Candidatus Ozemobacteraceae bacterium]
MIDVSALERPCLQRIFALTLFGMLLQAPMPVTAEPGPAGGALALRKASISGPAVCRDVQAPEGVFIKVFNDTVAEWVARPLDAALVAEIRTALAPHLRIELTPRGFAPAATRTAEGEADTTNYDAIWVRDNVWVYYALARDPGRRIDARRLLLALWDYYATPVQVGRFEAVIADPSLALDQMAMPHIRFNGRSPTLDDVLVDGRPETWNHRQIDAHGLFFTALAEAASDGLLEPGDLNPARFRVLALYPRFLERISFDTYEDAGAWEELPRRNTSSIALATRSLQAWRKLLDAKTGPACAFGEAFRARLGRLGPEACAAWAPSFLASLIDRGMARVRRQLFLGGESPDYDPSDIRFRQADAALLVLIQPSPLEGLAETEQRAVLQIVQTLERPAGILRYDLDSYQAGNFWIRPPAENTDQPSLTGDTSSNAAFRQRLSQLLPDTEAQWFFDSLCALARLHLAERTTDPRLRQQDLHRAAVHIKRALGQITGPALAADGRPVREWQTPESINTVVLAGRRLLFPSPITPLNWARAGLDLALREYARVAFGKKE